MCAYVCMRVCLIKNAIFGLVQESEEHSLKCKPYGANDQETSREPVKPVRNETNIPLPKYWRFSGDMHDHERYQLLVSLGDLAQAQDGPGLNIETTCEP